MADKRFSTWQSIGNALGIDVSGLLPLKVVRVPLAFNTPGLVLTGATLYEPTVGDVLVYALSFLDITTAWNGTTPKLHFGQPGALSVFDGPMTGPVDLGTVSSAIGTAALPIAIGHAPTSPILFRDTLPFTAMVDNGSGGNPNSTQGNGVLTLVIAAPE